MKGTEDEEHEEEVEHNPLADAEDKVFKLLGRR